MLRATRLKSAVPLSSRAFRPRQTVQTKHCTTENLDLIDVVAHAERTCGEIYLNRPHTGNVLSQEFIEDIDAALLAIEGEYSLEGMKMIYVGAKDRNENFSMGTDFKALLHHAR